MPTRARILVIDDDPLFRSLIVSLLRKEFLVSVASEGSEGFYKSLEHPPDIAIVDIQMPGWDGLKTLEAFHKHPFLNRVKILIMTSDSSRETVVAAMHGGASDYVVKSSFSKDELYTKLHQLLRASVSLAPEKPAPAQPAPVAVPSSEDAAAAVVPEIQQVASDEFLATNDHEELLDLGLQEIIDAWD